LIDAHPLAAVAAERDCFTYLFFETKSSVNMDVPCQSVCGGFGHPYILAGAYILGLGDLDPLKICRRGQSMF